ncbi:hypothetical protein PG911_07945 [Tenacibaculum ovolyticum]|uniref:tetratricopeptide repeat protein n=1 Tax=Tenacibaculum ovolyticum TaxID=104270 RepID=UPI0007ED1C56|nr:hypothetical protein [Tenacibaculum ovolyticum]WBX78173.1 hypothetical protein PG911_07945 [Tenacibaculum ovolyticum]
MSFLNKIFNKKDKKPTRKEDPFSEGDLFYCKIDNQYYIYKLLINEDDYQCYHVLIYSPLNRVPEISDIEKLSVFAHHSPIDKNGFTNPILLTKTSIKSEDLIGYHEYLRQTQNPEYYISIANSYYKNGYSLTTNGKHIEAIDEYSKAIDLFPQFFEAIDNRAFCKMDLGMFPEAIEDFSLSLKGNTNSLLAEFSIGECHFKMENYAEAKKHFEIAHNIDKNNETPIKFLEKVDKILNEK